MKLDKYPITLAIAGTLGASTLMLVAQSESTSRRVTLPPGADAGKSAGAPQPGVDAPKDADAEAADEEAADAEVADVEAADEEAAEAAAEKAAAFEAAVGSRPQQSADDDFLPPSYPPQRYAATWSNSPFDREILPPVPEIKDDVNPLHDYRVVGIGKIGGKYLVTIVDKKNIYKTIRSTPDKESGLYVEAVSNGTDPKGAKVKISDGTQDAEIGFDEKRLAAAPKGGVAPKVVPSRGGGSPRTVGRPNPASNLTPQQLQAKAKANEQLVQHLRNAAAKNQAAATTTAGAANTNANANTNTTPQATSTTPPKPKRRRVVLPPTTNR